MTSHDRVVRMHFAERPTLVLDLRSKKTSGELVFHFFDPRSIGVAKEKPNHPIFEDTIDKRVNNCSQLTFAAELLKKAVVHEYGLRALRENSLHHTEL